MSEGYTLFSIAMLAIVAGVIIAIAFSMALVHDLWFRIGAGFLAVIVVSLFIYANVATFRDQSTLPPQPGTVTASQDPFVYDPGSTATGVVAFVGNAVALPDQYSCLSKSANTTWENSACQCKSGFYGTQCEFSAFANTYVSLTTDTQHTVLPLPSVAQSALTTWPLTDVAGCTNSCDTNPACLGVTYGAGQCTQFTSLSFGSAPIQSDADPPVTATTLYLNRSRLLGDRFNGYFNIVWGVIPTRYFVGNGITATTSSNIHVTTGGARIGYYAIGINFGFSGIPDLITVSTLGTLYISTSPIPPRASIVPGTPTLIQYTAPVAITKGNFPFSQTNFTYNIRLDPP